MRILYWSDFFRPYVGGPETLSASLLPALRDRGCEVAVVTSHHHLDLPDEETFRGMPVRRFRFHEALAKRDFGTLNEISVSVLKLLREFRPDVVHLGAFGPSVWFFLRARNTHRTPFLATLQRELLPSQSGESNSLLAELLGNADWIRTVSKAVLEQACCLAPEIRGRSSVVYSFNETVERAYTPAPSSDPYILCLGRHVPVKGFDLGIRAFSEVRNRIPEARLVVAGDGPGRDSLRLQAAALRLDGSVDFPGWIPPGKVGELMQSSSIVFIPSRSEGLPVVAIQAARSGRPIVGTAVGGIPEVVHDGLTGLLVPEGSVPGMADALCELLEHPDRTLAMGRKAFELAGISFGKERCISSFLDIYSRLARNGAGVP